MTKRPNWRGAQIPSNDCVPTWKDSERCPRCGSKEKRIRQGACADFNQIGDSNAWHTLPSSPAEPQHNHPISEEGTYMPSPYALRCPACDAVPEERVETRAFQAAGMKTLERETLSTEREILSKLVKELRLQHYVGPGIGPLLAEAERVLGEGKE